MSDKRRQVSGSKREQRYFFQNINDLIHQQWPRLTYEEVGTYRTDYSQFCEAVKKEYGVSQEEIDRS